ncbi:MAG: site-specific integrase, partial [Azonexus sp.]|nr:site-specific integrase [Azonexus sp.]
MNIIFPLRTIFDFRRYTATLLNGVAAMPPKSSVGSNIQNRSPWLVKVRSKPLLDKLFAYGRLKDAEAYCLSLGDDGLRASLVQLDTAFQLRLRRKGARVQFVTFDTFEEAEQARLKIESDLSVSIIRDYAVAARTTLREIMVRYRDEVVPMHKGAEIERIRINRMLRTESFVDKKLAALCTEDLQDFITDRLGEVAPATVDRDLDMLSQVIRYSAEVWKIAAVESPFVGLRRPKYFNERDRRLSRQEEHRLLEAADADANPFVTPAVILALETAARRGELLSITPGDVFLDERYILLRETKNGRSRKVPLTKRALEVITALMSDSTSDQEPLLNLTPNALKVAFFKRVIPASGIQDLHFHDLRHEAISRLAESGQFQLIELQTISGHRDTRMLL